MAGNQSDLASDIDYEKLEIKDDEEWTLTSPIWTIPIDTFLEDNCITFEDQDENAIEHFKLHKEFVALCEDLLERVIMEIGVDQLAFAKAVAVGVRNPEFSDTFEQLYYLDDFNFFKSLMVKKNAELNFEAIKALETQGFKMGDEPQEKTVEYMQKEKSELDYAILISKQQEDELKRLQTQEDDEFMEALRLSELSFKMEQDKRKDVEVVPQQAAPQPPKAEPKIEEKPVEKQHPLFTQLQQEKEVQKKLQEAFPPVQKTESSFAPLPSINLKGGLGFKKMPELKALEKKRDEIADELEKKKEAEDKAAVDERRKRIMEQREKLQEQKKLDREAQLMKYEELKNEKETNDDMKVTDGEKAKRKQIYDMLRG